MKDIIENYKDIIINKYAQFEGRASRREFWYFALANFLISFILGLVEGMLGISPHREQSILADAYTLLVLIPSIAVAARRLHDIDKSGWWMLVPLYNIYLFFQKGHPGTNRFNTGLAPIPTASASASAVAATPVFGGNDSNSDSVPASGGDASSGGGDGGGSSS